MRHKGEILTNFIHFVTHVERETGQKLKKLRCDHGGEYYITSFRDYCNKAGIDIEYTSRYTSQQNGVSERSIRTITSMFRSLLEDANYHTSTAEKHCKLLYFLRMKLHQRYCVGYLPMKSSVPNLKSSELFVQRP